MKYFISILIVFTCSFAIAKQINVSVSTNGKYAVSVDDAGKAYLWNLGSKSVGDLGSNYSLSTYFIPNSDNYLLQNKDTKKVIVKSINGKIIKEFTPDFVAREQAINKNLTTWVGSIAWGDVYKYSISDMKKKQIYISWYMAKNDHNDYWRGNPPDGKVPSGTAMGSYFNFNFLGNTLIATPNNSLVVYDFDNHKWHKTNENVGQTMNAIDPNDEFVYTMSNDLVGTAVKYNLETNKIQNYLNSTNKDNFFFVIDKNEQLPFLTYQNKPNGRTNLGFIDKDKVLVTYKGVSQPFLWAGLYDINNIKEQKLNDKAEGNVAINRAIKYIPLVDQPKEYLSGNYPVGAYPNVSGYNTTFDTSVEAHKLVMAGGDGIMVYNYNPKDESLKLDWVGEPPKAESKEEKKGWFW